MRIAGTICYDCARNITGETVFIWDDIPLCFDCWNVQAPNKRQMMILNAINRGCQTTREIQIFIYDNYSTYVYTTAITSNIWILRKEKYLKTESTYENGKIIKIDLLKEIENFA